MIRDLELTHVDTLQKLALSAPAGNVVQTPDTKETAEIEVVNQPDREPESASLPLAGAASEVEPAQPATSAPQVSPERASLGEPATEAEAHWHDSAVKLRVGSWVEVVSNSQKMRCKLAAVIKATGKYIFVNRNGAKIAEYDLNQVAAAMASGELALLDDGLIFDRALESIIDNLRHSRRD